MAEIVGIEITKPLPATAVVASTYKIEGTVKMFGAVGAPPFVYAEVKHKEWYKPEFAEDKDYIRGWPIPITGDFSIDFKPEKEGDYTVKVIATPALIPLPAIGVWPTVGESDVMKVAVGQKPPAVFRFSGMAIDGNKVSLTNHDADSRLLIQKKTTDYLEIVPSYEWVGSKKSATISIKAGYRDWAGGFTPKTDAYTASIELPESPDTPYSGVGKAITIPLTTCGDLSDGAIEIVAKLPGMSDYISRIWNVYATKPAVVSFRFSAIIIDGWNVPLGNHDADSGLLLPKTTADNLSITPAFEWQGAKKAASISIKVGYRDWAGGFTPKTDAYTATFELPDSIDKKYSGQLASPIKVPLIACGGLTDGAIEVVLKISGFPDYITHIWNVYVTLAPEEKLGFDLTRPTVSQTPVAPGTTIDITCPVKSTCTKAVDATAKVIIYEGTLAPGHGTKIKDYDSGVFHINPGEIKNVIVHHTTIAGTIDRRDVEVEVYVGGQLIKESEWDDVYYVKAVEEVIAFDLTRPTASPSEVTSGATVTLTCPVTSRCTKVQSVTAKVLIYEGSIYTGHGTLLATRTVSFSISPGQTYNAVVSDTAVAGTIDRRDVEVEVYVGGQLIKESEWDDVYYVKAVEEEYTLTVSVDPYGGGTVIKSPNKTKYTKGEYVYLTATPASDYDFDRWSGDATGSSTSVTVVMDKNKSVAANFKKKLPDPYTKVTFTVKGDGFPFLTSYWILYHYGVDGRLWQDYLQHSPGDIITVRSVTSQGKLSCFCCSSVTGKWSEQKYGREFLAEDGKDYRYDIASGIVYYR